MRSGKAARSERYAAGGDIDPRSFLRGGALSDAKSRRRPDAADSAAVLFNHVMPPSPPDVTQPLEAKVNPRRWTTKVNVAMVVAVVIVFAVGAAYAIYAAMRPGEVREDVQEEVTAPGRL